MRGELRTFCLLLALSTSACSAPETAMTSDKSSPDSAPSTAEMEAKYKRNPAPKQPYQIVLKVADAPGPFAVIDGSVDYEAPDCTYIPDPIAGATMNPSYSLPIKYSKVDETTYAATVYADAMLDEDYLGKGMCHWELSTLNAVLKASGANTDTSFVANLQGREVRAQQARTNFYAKYKYPGSEPSDISEFGKVDRNRFKPELQDQLFTITLTPEAGTP